MSERGVFAIDRDIFDHPFFEVQPFTEREAWIWLIKEAAWKPRSRRIKKFVVNLGRGQLAASIRGMAEVWQWHRAKVERFLKRLQTETMIETASDQGVTVITVCNYDKYQRVSMPTETATETPKRDSSETIENTLNPLVPLPPGEADGKAWEDADKLADELAVLCWGNVNHVPMQWCGATRRIFEAWFPAGWTRSFALPECQKQFAQKNKRDGPPKSVNYFEKGLAEAFARAKQPLPQIRVNGHAKPANKQSEIELILARQRERYEERERHVGAGASPRVVPAFSQSKS